MAEPVNYRIAQNQKPLSGATVRTDEEGRVSIDQVSAEYEIRVDTIHAYDHAVLYEGPVTENDEEYDNEMGRGLFLISAHGTQLLVGVQRRRPQRFNLSPRSDFSFTPASPVAGEEITFSDESVPDGMTVVRWVWSWGDGSDPEVYTTNQDVTHTFVSNGRYKVTLTILNSQGIGAKKSETIYIG